MLNFYSKVALTAFTPLILSPVVNSAPVSLTNDQMDIISGGAFVCPVIMPGSENANLAGKGKFVQPEADYYSVIGPDVNVPMLATNNDGAATPHSNYLSPGDVGYTAIWY